MRYIIAIILLVSVPAFAQEKPDPALALQSAELEQFSKLAQADDQLNTQRAYVGTVLSESDKLITGRWWNKKQRQFAIEQRRLGLMLAAKLEGESTRLREQFQRWQTDVRTRANCADCEIDLQNRRLVKPTTPAKGK